MGYPLLSLSLPLLQGGGAHITIGKGGKVTLTHTVVEALGSAGHGALELQGKGAELALKEVRFGQVPAGQEKREEVGREGGGEEKAGACPGGPSGQRSCGMAGAHLAHAGLYQLHCCVSKEKNRTNKRTMEWKV